MTYAMLYQCLIEAEARVKNRRLTDQQRNNSSETVSIIEERMKMDGLTREILKADYQASLLPEDQR